MSKEDDGYPEPVGIPGPPRRSRFSDLVRLASPEHTRAHNERSWEESTVRWTMNRLKLGPYVHEVRERGFALSDSDASHSALTWAGFNEVFTTFPFYMASSRLQHLWLPAEEKFTPDNWTFHGDERCREVDRSAHFARTPYMVAFDAMQHSKPVSRPTALVFPRAGCRPGSVVYEDDHETYWTKGLVEVYKHPKHDGCKIYRRLYQSLIDEIHADGRGWRPD